MTERKRNIPDIDYGLKNPWIKELVRTKGIQGSFREIVQLLNEQSAQEDRIISALGLLIFLIGGASCVGGLLFAAEEKSKQQNVPINIEPTKPSIEILAPDHQLLEEIEPTSTPPAPPKSIEISRKAGEMKVPVKYQGDCVFLDGYSNVSAPVIRLKEAGIYLPAWDAKTHQWITNLQVKCSINVANPQEDKILPENVKCWADCPNQ